MSESNRTKVHVIPHTHWDREWYFTTSRSKVYLVKHVKEVLNALENIEGFHYYLLDAQGSACWMITSAGVPKMRNVSANWFQPND